VITNGAPEVVDILLDPVENLGLEQQLQQGQWLLEDLGGRGVIDNLQTKLKFDSQGRISGLAGCNQYFGQYKLNGGNLKISNIASTRKACSEAVANQESLFLNALERAYQIRIDGPYLLIYSKGLKQPLKFTLLY
jgi:putative lipoprotein